MPLTTYKRFKRLLISREARCLIGRHAWHHPDRRAFGFLVGTPVRLYFALPVDGVELQDAGFGDCLRALLPMATAFAAEKHMSIIGYYMTGPRDAPKPTETRLMHDGIVFDYCTICCPSCSAFQISMNGKALPDRAIAEAPGKRITHVMNQRRALSAWNLLLKRTSYLSGLSGMGGTTGRSVSSLSKDTIYKASAHVQNRLGSHCSHWQAAICSPCLSTHYPVPTLSLNRQLGDA